MDLLRRENKEKKLLDFDQWLEEYEDDAQIYYAETGRDREFDFELERELENDYASYCELNKEREEHLGLTQSGK